MTIRLRALLAFTCALIAAIGFHVPIRAQAEGSLDLSLVRLELSTTSDWATVTLRGVTARMHRTVEVSAGAELISGAAEWTLVGTEEQPSRAVIEVITSGSSDTASSLVLQKGRAGTATVHVVRLSGPTPAPVTDATLTTQSSSSNAMTVALDQSVLRAGPLVVPPLDPRRLTLAFYYPWFGGHAPKEWSIAPDKPTGAYDTWNPSHVSTMVGQAASSGVDGFIVSWDGGTHGPAVDLVMAAAAKRSDFAIAPLVELQTMTGTGLFGGKKFDAVRAAEVTRSFFGRAPAGTALTVAGRPVVVTFGMWGLSSADWASYLSLLSDLNPFVVGDRTATDFPVDGFYRYDPNDQTASELQASTDRAVDLTRLTSVLDPSVDQMLWAATVSPGFDNRASAPVLRKRSTPREGGARYDRTWAIALGSQPDWVLITSWNEWYEQTHIAPGTITGSTALDQTARWSAKFRSG